MFYCRVNGIECRTLPLDLFSGLHYYLDYLGRTYLGVLGDAMGYLQYLSSGALLARHHLTWDAKISRTAYMHLLLAQLP